MNLINSSDKIFIAGHNGMAGKAIVRSLLKKGYKNLLCPSKNQLDLRNSNKVAEWFKNNKPDVVIIAAAKVGGILANKNFPVDFLLENLKIQNNIIENAYINKTKRLLFLGSSCIYPKNASQPIKEEYLLNGKLESTNEWYAIAKIAGIKLCEALRVQYDFDAISLMPTNLYGLGDNYHQNNSHVLPALIKKFHDAVEQKKYEVTCWGSGNPFREFLHVDDLGDACTYALEKWDPRAKNAPKQDDGNLLSYINIGSGEEISIKELAILIAEIIGFKGNIKWDKSKPDGTFKKRLDIRRAQELGWEAQINLHLGLKKTYKDFLNELKSGTLRVN